MYISIGAPGRETVDMGQCINALIVHRNVHGLFETTQYEEIKFPVSGIETISPYSLVFGLNVNNLPFAPSTITIPESLEPHTVGLIGWNSFGYGTGSFMVSVVQSNSINLRSPAPKMIEIHIDPPMQIGFLCTIFV